MTGEEATMNELRHIPLSQDAALVIGLAGTAMPFAHSAEDEAERWLRALRLHGHVGAALQALGIGEAPLMTGSVRNDEPAGSPPLGAESMENVARRAEELALKRESRTVGTVDLLFAILESYGRLFDRALYLRGSSREELVERLAQIEYPANNNHSAS
jgi:hypothetical protein